MCDSFELIYLFRFPAKSYAANFSANDYTRDAPFFLILAVIVLSALTIALPPATTSTVALY